MSALPTSIVLRPSQPSDQEFLGRVYASTREDELAVVPFTDAERAAFIAQQYAAQSAHFATHYAAASYDVVEVDGDPAGRLIVMRSEGEILLVDIALLPEFRGQGVGSHLVAAILDEADAAQAKVSLYVESFNRAQRLYTRSGFVQIGTNGVYIQMEREPREASGEDRLVASPGAVGSQGDQEDVQRPERAMLEPVNPLDEDRVDRSSEGDGERRAEPAGVHRAGAGLVGLRADQLQVEPKGVGMNDERVAHERSEVIHGQAVEHGRDANRGFTRRRALQVGAMTALSAMWAGPSLARAATNSTPVYLRRASYTGLVGTSFKIDGGNFTLASVSDLAGAVQDAALRGNDEAFVLEFDGQADALGSGIHQFSHPDVGSYAMFASPVGGPDGGSQRYEVVVDRSVGRPADPPDAPDPPAPVTIAAKEAAAAEVVASTPLDQIPGAPAPAKPASKRKRKARSAHRTAGKAKHVTRKPAAKSVKSKVKVKHAKRRAKSGRSARSRRRK
jgi:ribosomal protein S18 acetylase RimI-like enzyme